MNGQSVGDDAGSAAEALAALQLELKNLTLQEQELRQSLLQSIAEALKQLVSCILVSHATIGTALSPPWPPPTLSPPK